MYGLEILGRIDSIGFTPNCFESLYVNIVVIISVLGLGFWGENPKGVAPTNEYWCVSKLK